MPKMHKSLYTMRLTSFGQCNHWRICWRNENSNKVLCAQIGPKSDPISSAQSSKSSDLVEFWPSLPTRMTTYAKSLESSKVTARVQSNYFPTDIGCRLLPPPQSNLSDTTLNYRIETYYNNNDLVPDFIPKNSSNLNQVKEDLFGQFGSFKNVSLSRFENLSQTCPKPVQNLSQI